MPEVTSSAILQDEILRDAIEEAFEGDKKIDLLRMIGEAYPADVAEALSTLNSDTCNSIFKMILLADVTMASEVLIELEPSRIANLYKSITPQEWAWILHELSDDDMVAILDVLPEEARARLFSRLSREDRQDVMQLMNYPDETAGRMMTTEFISMDVNDTVAGAIQCVHGARDIDPTNLFFVYVTENKKLVGMVSLRGLLIHKKTDRLRDIMRTDVSPVHVNMDQEEVAEIVRRYDEVTVPVVDEDNHLLGIITVDDIIDVIDEESDDDIYKIIGSSGEELMVGGNTRKIVALRLPWILASFFGSLMVAFVMKYTESDLFGPMAGKIFVFVPMICAMGGNVGVQSATIMARLLSTGSLDWREARRSLLKEARVGFVLGLICGTLIGGIATLWGGPIMLLTVMTAMVCAMTTAAATGTVIPVLMKQLGFDPALATGPFVTSFNDLVATIVYFSIAYSVMDLMVF